MFGDFFSVEVEFYFAVCGGGDEGEVFVSVVDLGAAFEFSNRADVVVELAVFEEEDFTSLCPFSDCGGVGCKGAVL